jgi:hypothetical protein
MLKSTHYWPRVRLVDDDEARASAYAICSRYSVI